MKHQSNFNIRNSLFVIRYSFLFLTLSPSSCRWQRELPGRLTTSQDWSPFQSSDPQLQKLHDSATEKIQRHLIEYAPGFKVLANSGDYTGLFLENAALNGENYARFDPQFALNNIRAFFITQRDDGKFPNVVWPGYRMREMNRKAR